MQFNIEKYVSNFVEKQFPQFYQEEGPNFILFTKAYYEWMEEQGNPTREARTLLDYRDIDNTLESFLEHFQKKYLYGIPFNVIINKRFLLKHILDVYRSKGSIQCYRLLFKLIYNEDVEIYLPGRDILKPSDGTWIKPKYLEVTYTEDVKNYVGKTIIGLNTKTTAVVESYSKEGPVVSIYLSNILPNGGEFDIGEGILPIEQSSNSVAVSSAPSVIGSLDYLEILNGGQNFQKGDILKIAKTDPFTGEYITKGNEGYVKVESLSRGFGSLTFSANRNKGFGSTLTANVFISNDITDKTGNGASFSIGTLSSTQRIEYNTDIICDYESLTIDAASYGFPASPSANQSSNVGIAFSYANDLFGVVSTLTNIKTGNGYTAPADVDIRATIVSNTLSGNIAYVPNDLKLFDITINTGGSLYSNTDKIKITNVGVGANCVNAAANVVTDSAGKIISVPITDYGNAFASVVSAQIVNSTGGSTLTGSGASLTAKFLPYAIGTSTNFPYYFSNDAIIVVQANTTPSTQEYIPVRTAINTTCIFLKSSTKYASEATATYRVAPVILPSNFAPYDTVMFSGDGSVNGTNELIEALPSVGNNIVGSTVLFNSGKGFVNGENVKAYLYGSVSSDITIVSSGTGYSNSDLVVFSGGEASKQATANVVTDNSGNVTSISLTYGGSGYLEPPRIIIKTSTGSGAVAQTSLLEFNTTSEVVGIVVKRGVGSSKGYWSTTRGFLNSDKYIQDSYYYQDYSYELRVGQTLNKYKDILYNTFHSSGSELFGKFLNIDIVESDVSIQLEMFQQIPVQVDSTIITVDNTLVSSDAGVQ